MAPSGRSLWPQGEHSISVVQQNTDPARPVVQPLRIDNALALHSEDLRQSVQQLSFHGS